VQAEAEIAKPGYTSRSWGGSLGYERIRPARSAIWRASSDTPGTGETLLHVASKGGLADIAALLLWRGADAKALAGGGLTALHLAAQGGHTGVAALLLGHGAEINAIDDLHQGTPYGWARFQRREETPALLRRRVAAPTDGTDG
jgi:ankyrin repeat protein